VNRDRQGRRERRVAAAVTAAVGVNRDRQGRRERRVAAAVTAAVAMLLAASPARADTTSELAAWLPADAPVVLRIDPAAADGVMALAQELRLPGLSGNGLLLVKLAARATIGFDPTSSEGWHRAGFDRDAPVLIAVARIDLAAAAAAYQAPKSDAADPRAPVWHSRLVWRARHAPGARDALRELLALAPGRPVNAGRAVAARLLAPGVLAVARVEGDVVVVDFLASWAGGESADELVARLPGKPAGRGFADRPSTGAAAELGRVGLTAWVDPARAIDAWVALRQSLGVRLFRAGLTEEPRADHRAACAGVRAAATGGAFTDLAVRLEAGPGSATTRTVWGLREPYGLAARLVAADDRLLSPPALAGAVVAGVLYLRGLAPLRALPRSEAFSGGLRRLREAIDACGPAGAAVVAAVGWPQVTGMMLDDIASIGPEAEILVEGVRNLGFAIQRASLDRDRLIGVAEASVSVEAAALIERIAGVFFGNRTERSAADRPHTTWGVGPARLFRRSAAGDRAVFGFGRAGESVRWYLGGPADAAAAPPDRLAHLVASPRTLVGQLGLGGPAATLLAPFTRVEATLAVEGALLVGTWVFTP
jgi:hypothetical protein